VGVLEDVSKMATIGFKAERDIAQQIWIIGGFGSHLGQSLWLREIHGREDGPPPTVDLDKERKVGELIREAIANGWITAVHDCSDGGLLVAFAEMALAGNVGATLWDENLFIADAGLNGQLFGEDQGRFVVTVADAEDYRVVERAKELNIDVWWAGLTGGADLVVGDGITNFAEVPLADLRAAHESFFKNWMEA
jgi:phosphoribosylformylglycinamidine synthase subunit PurL